MPAKLDDVRKYALGFPHTTESSRRDNPAWLVDDKTFAWLRAFSKADIKRFGDEEPPTGEIIAVVTIDLADKEAILNEGTKGFFTIEHFNNYPGFLIQLNKVSKRDLKTALFDAWLARAPKELTKPYME